MPAPTPLTTQRATLAPSVNTRYASCSPLGVRHDGSMTGYCEQHEVRTSVSQPSTRTALLGVSTKLTLIVATAIGYTVLFVLLYPWLGGPTQALAMVPVGLAGWLF
jgi:hypothetical protein